MNPHDSIAQTHANDLSWQAFLYVSGELTPDEVVDFEERLLADQDAREAVARAAKMTEGVWLASAMDMFARPAGPVSAVTASEERRGLTRWTIWLASTVIVAGLAFCVGWWFANPQTAEPDGQIANAPADDAESKESALAYQMEGAEQLLELWTDSEFLISELEFGPKSDYPAELSEDLASRDDADPEDDEFAWMLAALCDPPTDESTSPVMEN